MKVPEGNIEKWSPLRRLFNLNLFTAADYVEVSYKPDMAQAIIGKFEEFIATHEAPDLPEEEINSFVADIADEDVRHHVGLHLHARRKHALNALKK